MYRSDDPARDPPLEPSKVRKGRFLWMDPSEQRQYLDSLTRRIAQGYFFSDQIIGEIVDEIAPVIDETIEGEFSVT